MSMYTRNLMGAGASAGLAQAIADGISANIPIIAPSGSDISRQIADVIDELGVIGGTVQLPPGLFYVQGVSVPANIVIRGAGRSATILSLPVTPTDHMFKLADTNDHIQTHAPAFFDLSMTGDNTKSRAAGLVTGYTNAVAYNAIHNSALISIYGFQAENCNFYYFADAIHLENDAHTALCYVAKVNNCVFWYNAISLTANEEIEVTCTNFQWNGTAFRGCPNDGKFVQTEFESNQIAIAPGLGTPSIPQNFIVSSCLFFKQSTYDMQIGVNSIVIGNSFVGDESFTTYGIGVMDAQVLITGNKFNEGSASYKDAPIKLLGLTGSASSLENIQILNNRYIAISTANTGPFVKCALANVGSGITGIQINNNTWIGQRNQFFAQTGSHNINGYQIDNNVMSLTAGDMTAATPISLITINASTTGGSISGNTITAYNGTKINWLSGVFSKLTCVDNKLTANGTGTLTAFQSFTAGTTVDDNSIIQRNGNLLTTKVTGQIVGGVGVSFATANLNLTINPSTSGGLLVNQARRLKTLIPANAAAANVLNIPYNPQINGLPGGTLNLNNGPGNWNGASPTWVFTVSVFDGDFDN